VIYLGTKSLPNGPKGLHFKILLVLMYKA